MMNAANLQNIPIAFPVWELPGQVQLEFPGPDEPHVEEGRIVGVSVYHRRPFTDGQGAIVTSYDPRAWYVDRHQQADGHRFDSREGHHFGVVVRGPMALARAMAQRLADELNIDQTEPSPLPTKDAFVFPIDDVFVQCGNGLVPALGFDIGIPEARVIVSANMSTHPVVLGFWRWPVTLPVLGLAEFNWE